MLLERTVKKYPEVNRVGIWGLLTCSSLVILIRSHYKKWLILSYGLENFASWFTLRSDRNCEVSITQSKWIYMFFLFKRYRKYLSCLPEAHSPLVWKTFFSEMPVYSGWTSWLQSGPHKYSMRERFPIFSTEMIKVDWPFWQIKETLSSFKFCLQLDSSWKLLGMTSLVMLTEAHWVFLALK